ncbi:hypothetical protein ASPBRDRAFT_60002 [Aspergillus brasiliensis CBS 101740]|uniref:Glycosyltransferase family 28 N-terminal domain-containing protein n=1 Tax=Aspergillus brasiliensis (strain CBS 101740 / IMI 381727 / IBT 21946) TaxID=767769 RepID=A0A1L9U3C1_ASPBC|nr:hypothetical protein ASPBRDRAFT_60002 [Aspergillus brasiliensis CBS 101740]
MTSNEGSETFGLPAEYMRQPAGTGKGETNVNDDGRVTVDWDSTFVRRFSKLYTGPFIPRPSIPPPEYSELPAQFAGDPAEDFGPPPEYPETTIKSGKAWKVKLNIVIQVVGSQGDVQPFIAIGQELQRYGHRVRLASHNIFEDFIRESGLEFYLIGDNPAELMAYMVKNPGLIPAMESLRAGKIRRKRMIIREILDGCWRSYIEPDIVTGQSFVADTIIANPPSFAHVHCAQALSIPVHLIFTMPWSSTEAFPHPLANMKGDDTDKGFKNYVSYGVVSWLIWQGVGDVINKWRKKLDLEEIAMFKGPHLPEQLRVPFTYYWSTDLVPRASDWPAYIDICGFIFRESPQYEPPADLQAFLASGPPPIYISFGSIMVENPDFITATVVNAVNAVGVQAIISRGWSNLSGTDHENIYYIGDCPHEWLFEQMAAIVHHGGAGTTACGSRKSKPTLIIPFFGEMESEAGVHAAVSSFHRHLPLERLECDLYPGQPAVWSCSRKGTKVKFSKIAAETLVADGLVKRKSLTMHAISQILIENRRWDPITGGASAVMCTATDLTELQDYYEGRSARPPNSISNRMAQESRNNPCVDRMSKNDERSPHGIDTAGFDGSIKTPSGQGRGRILGKMARASAKSLGSFVPTALKGMTVDIPLALTEGLRNVPRYYGEEPRDHGAITNIKSGFTVAGKGFAWGMAEAVSDVIIKPYQGIQEDGPRGAVTGLGKGMANMASKAGCAMFGVIVYPSAGIAKSLHTLIHSQTGKQIANARHGEGMWLRESNQYPGTDNIVFSFQEMLKRGKR